MKSKQHTGLKTSGHKRGTGAPAASPPGVAKKKSKQASEKAKQDRAEKLAGKRAQKTTAAKKAKPNQPSRGTGRMDRARHESAKAPRKVNRHTRVRAAKRHDQASVADRSGRGNHDDAKLGGEAISAPPQALHGH